VKINYNNQSKEANLGKLQINQVQDRKKPSQIIRRHFSIPNILTPNEPILRSLTSSVRRLPKSSSSKMTSSFLAM